MDEAAQEQRLAAWRAFHATHPGLKFVDVMLTDPNGVQRGKRAEVSEMESICRHGRPIPGTAIGLDITGQDVDGTDLAWIDGDADRPAYPIPHSFSIQPWATTPTAQVLLSYVDRDGSPHPLDPRHVLARAIAGLASQGLHPMGSVELEFYLVDAEALRRGQVTPHAGHDTGRQGYGIAEIETVTPFLEALYAACAAQDLPVRTTISEYGPGQFEITLQHRADILRAADEAILYKRAVKAVARQHGMAATFMAKPFAGQSGSGMHLHLSLTDARGRNLFEAAGGDDLLHHAIGGMAATMAESMLIFAPNANSYRRFEPESYAPVIPNWGVNNRTVAFRIPEGPAGSRRIEHRVAGADANPYLVLAVVLAAIRDGIAHRLDPGPPTTGNGYLGTEALLPPDWLDAIRTFKRSGFLRGTLGSYFADIYATIKLGEYRRFQAVVPPLDIAWYLGIV
jgi:glutamine synthetase